jgi:hypothetical protein
MWTMKNWVLLYDNSTVYRSLLTKFQFIKHGAVLLSHALSSDFVRGSDFSAEEGPAKELPL